MADSYSNIASDESGRLLGRDISKAWNAAWPYWKGSYERIDEARKLLAGELRAPLPKEIQIEGGEAFRVSLPGKYTQPLKLISMLGRKTPMIKRYAMGAGDTPKRIATLIEQNANSYMKKLYPWAETVDLIVNEGECAVITQPKLVAWEKTPDLYDQESLLNGKRVISGAYRRDKQGRAPDDDYYIENASERFRTNVGESTKAFKAAKDHYLAQHLPFECRAISRLNMIPVNPHYEGERVVVDGLIIKTNYRKSELLRKKYRWGEDQLLEATERNKGQMSDEKTLYEYWGKDLDDHVYVSYCVDGQNTWKVDDYGKTNDAILDLTELYGITELPIAYAYGWHWAGVKDPDQRGVPFVNPFGRSWLAKDTVATGDVFRHWSTAFPNMVYKPDPALIEWAGTAFADLKEIDMHPMKIKPILGDLRPVQSNAGAGDSAPLMAMLDAETTREAPAAGAYGAGDQPGYARNEQQDAVLGSVSQMEHGILMLAQATASFMLEISSAIGRNYHPVITEKLDKTYIEQTGEQSSSHITLKLDPDLCGNDFSVEAEYPKDISDNLGKNQLLAEWRDRGIIPTRQLLEAIGDPSPEQTMAEVMAENISKLPQFQGRVIARTLQILGDQDLADEIMKEMVLGPDGQSKIPAAAMAGMQGAEAGQPAEAVGPTNPMGRAGPQGGGMTGTSSLPNIAASSQGGQIAAPIAGSMQGE